MFPKKIEIWKVYGGCFEHKRMTVPELALGELKRGNRHNESIKSYNIKKAHDTKCMTQHEKAHDLSQNKKSPGSDTK